MVRSRKGIETLVNLINISYRAMKPLPYQEKIFVQYQGESVQEFRFVLSEQIQRLPITYIKHVVFAQTLNLSRKEQ